MTTRRHWILSPTTGVLAFAVVLVIGLAVIGSRHAHELELAPAGTFRTTDLIVDTKANVYGDLWIGSGAQAEQYSSFCGSNSDCGNIFIGGGGQFTFAVDPSHHNEGAGNVSLGLLSALTATTMFDSTIVGAAAGENITTGGDETCIGRSACGGSGPVTAHHLTCVGVNTCEAVTNGDDNACFALDACEAVQGGANNSCFGSESCAANVSGNTLACFGINTCALATASNSTMIGGNAGRDTTSGDNDLYLGHNAGGGIVTGRANTIIGTINGLPSALSNEIVLGDGDGNIELSVDTNSVFTIGRQTSLGALHAPQLSIRTPTSITNGGLSTDSTDSIGNVIAPSGSSLVLTYAGAGFPTESWCVANSNGTPQFISIATTKTTATFSCFAPTTGSAATCQPFTYHCWGGQ